MSKKEQKTTAPVEEAKKGQLFLEQRKFTPQDVIDGKEVDITYSDGSPVIKCFYVLKMKLLGKQVEFKMVCRDVNMKPILEDFYGITKAKELPIKIVKQVITNSDTGEVTSFNQLFVHMAEGDEVHKIQIVCQKVDKSKFQMALEEYATKYVVPEEVIKYRKERYEAVLQSKNKGVDLPDEDVPF